MTKENILAVVFCLVAGAPALAQRFPEHSEIQERNKGKAFLVHLTAGIHQPGANFADRFGTTGSVGGGLEWIAAGNFLLGAEAHYSFGNTVKEDPLVLLRTPEGDIIGNNQLLAEVDLRARGLYVGGAIGKLFPIGNRRSGIRLTLGAGVQQHRIRIQDNANSVAQVSGDYVKGYDRLTGGLALSQFVGWQHLGANRRSNWFLGFEFSQGFTKSLRDWDFAEMRKLEGNRTDIRFGIRLGWTLPFYIGAANQIYY
ncbi:MAG: hypothetical protein IPM98_07410 [Lewinellaceae bacterium]|nr:hypothetical protein [Lewinellaceae bacterium]